VIAPSDRLASYLQPANTQAAAEVVRRYFTPRPTGTFTGAHFERLGGGGDRPAIANEFTAEDLIAVSMLSVRVVGNAALELLEHRRSRLHELLRLIPTDLTLGAVDGTEFTPEWPTRQLYTELRSVVDVGPTTASKLLARKRPHLVPVYDTVIATELGLVDGRLWQPLHTWLTADAHANESHLDQIRATAGLGTDISLLRVLDVLTWMVGKGNASELLPAEDGAQAVG